MSRSCPRCLRLGFALPLAALFAAPSCDGEDAAVAPVGAVAGSGGVGVDAGGGAGPCVPGALEMGGVCVSAGLPQDGCGPGELADEEGGCEPAGVPAALCGVGFEPDDDFGCQPILPAEPCASGTFAWPGETTCHEVAPCADGTWGDIPVEPNTEHVDGSYGGTDSDGSSSRPWTTIQQGIDSAEPGAIVAVAAGSYSGPVLIAGKPVRLWGRCPGLVEIISLAAGGPLLEIGDGAEGTEIRDLAITGEVGWAAVAIHDGLEARLDRIWLHDTSGARGIEVTEGEGAPHLVLTRSLIERPTVVGIMVWGASAEVEQAVVRDIMPGPESGVGRAINVSANTTTNTSSTAAVRSSVIEGCHEQAVTAYSSHLELDSVLIRDVAPNVAEPGASTAVVIDSRADLGDEATGVIRRSVIERATEFGLLVIGAHVTIDATVIRDTALGTTDPPYGCGLQAEAREEPPLPSNLSARFCLIEQSRHLGLAVLGSPAELEGIRVRDTLPDEGPTTRGVGLGVVPMVGLPPPVLALRGSIVENSIGVGVSLTGTDAVLDRTIVRSVAPTTDTERYGHGIECVSDSTTGAGEIALRGSLVEEAYEVGLLLVGCHGTVDQSVLRDVESSASAGRFGNGIMVNGASAVGGPPLLAMRLSRVERTRYIGVQAYAADLSIEGSVVDQTRSHAAGAMFGDALSVLAGPERGSATIVRSVLSASERAGISCFGSILRLGQSELECNAMQLAGEPFHGEEPTFEDLGGNACGCGASAEICQVRTSSLAPPDPIEAAPPPAE